MKRGNNAAKQAQHAFVIDSRPLWGMGRSQRQLQAVSPNTGVHAVPLS